MNDRIHVPSQVQKRHTTHVDAFVSAAGPLGEISEGVVYVHTPPPRRRPVGIPDGPSPPVALLRTAIGDDGRLLPHLVDLGYRGLVIEAAGGGSTPPSWAQPLEHVARHIPVLYAGRPCTGPTPGPHPPPPQLPRTPRIAGSVGVKNSSIEIKIHATIAAIGANAPTNGTANCSAGLDEQAPPTDIFTDAPQVTSDERPNHAELRAVAYLAQRRRAAADIGSPAAARRSHTSAGIPGGLRQAAAVALTA